MNDIANTEHSLIKHKGSVQPNSTEVETYKDESNYLHGTLLRSFADPLTGSIAEADTQLIKFHGTYQQDDRDQRLIRQEKKLEPAYSFMIRVRVPGGDLTSTQWLKLDEISDQFANSTLKLTTRQAVQFHGVIKFELKKTIQAMDEALLDSIAACGDVNRNVMCTPDPTVSPTHTEVFKWAEKISEHLLPKTRAYHEIWLDEGKGEGKSLVGYPKEEIEPLYGRHYLPRKFKIGIAIPPYNDADVYTNDVGIIAIIEHDKLQGFNVAVGGGMGMSFGRDDTYPRLATNIGFIEPENLLDVITRIVEIQRDYGNRADRKRARLKYTIDELGLEAFRQKLIKRLGYELLAERPVQFKTSADQFGWYKGIDDSWHLMLFIEHGRVKDTAGQQQKQALQAIAKENICGFRLTANQHLLLTKIKEQNKVKIEEILHQYGLSADSSQLSGMRRNAIACVAMNTCPLAMAEAERYLPELITKIEPILKKYNLYEDEIKIRMTGCPNGCGRSVMGEIGFIGKSLGRYNLYLGSSHQGDRLNKLYKENLSENEILSVLDKLLGAYASKRKMAEHFGDFVIREGYVSATLKGRSFHE
ncbi:MAG: NADPH-dependent assimilatory sulfite reductase hemoprotein subunit [Cocleimonas sp.]|nr:NADPH-dependent assimilatory sulfite reductase hemoprotein subunit [Cocleimonas sp.]